MRALQDDPVNVLPYWRIIFVRQLDFFLVLMPIMLWAGIVYYFLFEQDLYVNQWLDSQPLVFLLPIVLTFLSLMFFFYRARQVRYLFYHGKKIKGQVIKVVTKRHLTRFVLPIKTIVAYQYHYGGKHYKRRTHLLSSENLSPGTNVHIQIDPKFPGKGIIREIFMNAP